MKTNIMITREKVTLPSLLTFTACLLIFFSLSCEQPFRAGLGSVVDVRPPTVTLEAPGPGSYIWGAQRRFNGAAEDDYLIDYVEIIVTNVDPAALIIDDKISPAERSAAEDRVAYLKSLSDWSRTTLVKSVQNRGSWHMDIDTTAFPDGDLNIRVRATDSAGKTATTDEIIFLIRNEPPAIVVASPYIIRGDGAGKIGGVREEDANDTNRPMKGLNFGVVGIDTLPDQTRYERRMDMGSYITGTISYDEDIYTDNPKTEEGVERYPPQIRIWSIGDEPVPGEVFLPGYWPTLAEVPWQNFAYSPRDGSDSADDQLFPTGAEGNYSFMYQLEAAGCFYGFEIRAQSKDLRITDTAHEAVKFHYPRDYWSGVNAAWWENPAQSADPDMITESRYVLMYVKVQNSTPVVNLYELEDILGVDTWNPAVKNYDNLTGVSDDKYHPYVNRKMVNKNGPFTLRIRASHSDQILSAEAYWEREDGLRGRFIWDPAIPANAPGLPEIDCVDPAINPYSHWGYNDPHAGERDDSANPARSFIFTYTGTNADRIPDDAQYHSAVRGKTKVQVYTGSADWEEGKKSGLWPTATSGWSDIDPEKGLEEGAYNIEVYARSRGNPSGPIAYSPHKNTIRLDMTPPKVFINSIDGAFSAYNENVTDTDMTVTEATVNGVIRPKLRFSEAGSGLRGATEGDSYHWNADENAYGYEQRYLLVNSAAQMDNYIAANGKEMFWPPDIDTTSGFGDLTPGVTVYRAGPVFNSEFKFKTSKIYDTNQGAPELADSASLSELEEGVYWLYVFARDNAFNVGRNKPVKITVDQETDKPDIVFLAGITGDVTDPSESADNTDTGFIFGGSTRSQFGPSSTLRLRLRDDDSIDLGLENSADASGASSVKVTLSGAKSESDGPLANGKYTEVITALAEVDSKYEVDVPLSPLTIKDIFPAQSPDSSAPGGRLAVRAREGTISQKILLDALRGNANYDYLFNGPKENYSSLPDGIYRIVVTMDDFAPAKLILEDESTDPADVAHATIERWIVVDTTVPDIAVDPTSDTGYIDPSGKLTANLNVDVSGDGVVIFGTVSDRNGPITVNSFTFTRQDNTGTIVTEKTEVKIIPQPRADTDLYKADFYAPVHIDSAVSSEFTVTLQVKDRFGRYKSVEQQFKVDKTPPNVDLSQRIETFERDDPYRVYITTAGDNSITPDNRGRLANGIVSFKISASDNIKVKEVRYWLIEHPTTFTGWDHDGPTELPSNFSSTQYIDTTDLSNNTEYNLYVMAMDDAGLVSDSEGSVSTTLNYRGETTLKQTIFVRQEEDKPYFKNDSQGGIAGETDLIVRMTINDDDSFYNTAANGVRDNTVRVWVSTDTNATSTSPSALNDTGNTNGWSSVATINVNSWTKYGAPPTPNPDDTTLVSLQNSKNIKLAVDLYKIFPTELGTVNGTIHYVIEATDSAYGKFIDTNGTKTTTADETGHVAFWRESGTFVLDTKAPEVYITSPDQEKRFGKMDGGVTLGNDFTITGSIMDAYLKKDQNQNYIIGIRLDGQALYLTSPPPNSGMASFVLGKDTTDPYITAINTVGGETTVSFTIPAAAFLSAIGYDIRGYGNHTLVFMAEDQSGKTGSFSLNFVKDDKAPANTFAPISNTTPNTPQVINQVNGQNWWNANSIDVNNGTSADYLAKHKVALPVIFHDGVVANPPSISGTFTDEFSNINIGTTDSTLKVSFDNDPTEHIIPSAQFEGSGKTVRWTIYLTSDGKTGSSILTDGVHSIKFSVEDEVGNKLEAGPMYGFRLNSIAPAATITGPPQTIYGDRSNAPVGNTIFDIKATGSSRNLETVKVRMRYTGSEPYTNTPYEVTLTPSDTQWTFNDGGTTPPSLDVTETLTWTIPVTKANILFTTGASGVMTAGTYEITVIAIDRSGKQSAEETVNMWTFEIDTKPPEFSFTNLEADPADPNIYHPIHWLPATPSKTPNVLGDNSPSIRARVTDATSALNAVQVQLAKWNYNSSAWEIYNFTSSNWTGTLTSDGSWSTVSPLSSGGDVYEWSLPGGSQVANGYYSVRLRARDASQGTPPSTGWNVNDHDGNPATSHYAYFFIDGKPPVLTTTDTQTIFSSRYEPGYELTFNISATDENMFWKMEASVERMNTTGGVLPAPVPILPAKQTGTGAWTASATLAFAPDDVTNGLPDGSYRIVFTATDLAGKETRETRTITLDNRPPTESFITEPQYIGQVIEELAPGNRKHQFASVVKIGGESFDITGTTLDPSDNGSASGMAGGHAGIWYRIGYGTHNKDSLPTLTGSETPAERSAMIMAWAIGGNSGLSGVPTDTGSAYNDAFDTASKKTTNNSLWFKYTNYTTDTTYAVPNGIAINGAINLINWSLQANSSVAANYAQVFTGNGTGVQVSLDRSARYNNSSNPNNPYLARQIDETNLPQNRKRGGLYSLPLVIRVVDNAGNVYYELRDIWLYPNGDYPSVSINNPENNLGVDDARGGQISITGLARDNVSVNTVIYRVKTGNGNDSGAPLDANIVPMSGEEVWDGSAFNSIWVDGGSNSLTRTNWHVARLDSAGSTSSPWSFTINANKEITDLIATSRGFEYPVSGNSNTDFSLNNMIRVYVEVFAFDGIDPDNLYVFNKISLGGNAPGAPKPVVRELYITKSSASVSAPQISKVDIAPNLPSPGWLVANFDNVTGNNMSAADHVRRGKFAVRAELKGGNNSISAIQVRLPDELTDNGWKTVYENNAETPLTGLTLSPNTANISESLLTFSFDTTAASAAAGYKSVRGGAWNKSGGTFRVNVRVTNNAIPPATDEYTFEVGVDNFIPVADTVRTITSGKVAGSDVIFMGRVFDYEGNANSPQPDQRKIEEVRVWFTNSAGTHINMNTGAVGAASTTTSYTVWTWPAATVAYNGENVAGVTLGVAPSSQTCNIPYGDGAVKVINNMTPGGWSTTGDEDVLWSFKQNTRVLPDGPIIMHYVVFDHANNASYYTQTMVVMNNTLKITQITLYTNNIGEGSVYTTHDGTEAYSVYDIPPDAGASAVYRSAKDNSVIGRLDYATGYLNSGFISKNSVIGFGVETVGSGPRAGTANQVNGTLKYQLRYVERYLVPLTKTNLKAMVVGSNATSSLYHLDNDVTLNAQGVPSSTDPTEEPVTGFINFYTIAPGNSGKISASIWRTLGVSLAADGSHFVFQGVNIEDTDDPRYDDEKTPNVDRMDDYGSVYVYAYKSLLNTAEENPTNGLSIPLAEGAPSPLLFSGSSHFSTSSAALINEAKATVTANATPGDATGTAYFLLKVWDEIGGTAIPDQKDKLYDAVVIGMRVYLTDSVNPVARLYDLNPYTEINATGDDQETLNEAAAPIRVGDNILRGGLYNLGTVTAPIKSGYIDPRNNSTALNPYITRPVSAEDPYTGTPAQKNPNGYVKASTSGTVTVPADAVSTTGTDNRDKVSGRILLRGLAWDDQLVKNISITIGDGSPKKILELWYVYPEDYATDPSKRGTKYTSNTPSASEITTHKLVRKMMPETNVNAWAAEEISWRSGHTVEWVYMWDTTAEPTGRTSGTAPNIDYHGGPLNTTVAVTVNDLNGSLSSEPRTVTGAGQVDDTPTVTAPTSFHNIISVDIVPYITGLRRETPKFATKRSRQGWYSFYQGEGNITVLGFNLGNGDAEVNAALNSNSDLSGNGTTLTMGAYAANSNYPNDGHSFAIPDDAHSGRITVWVDSVDAWNHLSVHTTKSWNRENYTYTNGSDLWTNKPFAHIWRTNENSTSPATYFGNNTSDNGSWALDSPSMALEYGGNNNPGPGRLHGAWAIRDNFGIYSGINDGTARRALQTAQDPLSFTDIDYFPPNNTADAGINKTIVALYQWDGRPSVIINTNLNQYGFNNGNEIEPYLVNSIDTDTYRWQNPRTSMSMVNGGAGNAGRVYTSVYDSITANKSLYYLARVGTANYRVYIDGNNGAGVTFSNASGTTPTRSSNAGQWSAVDYVTNGGTNGTTIVPVIAYYDETNDTLRLAYGSSNNSNGANDWTVRYVLSSSDKLFKGSGRYVSIKVDKNNNIHLAFFNATYNTVVYAVGTRTGSFTAYAVDSVVTGGIWTDISVDNDGNPFIVYGDSGRTGNYDGVRIAYKDAKFTRVLRDRFGNTITGWEAITMPADYTVVADSRLNIEAWPPTDRSGRNISFNASSPIGGWHAAVGYAGNSGPTRMFRIGYYFKPAFTIPSGL